MITEKDASAATLKIALNRVLSWQGGACSEAKADEAVDEQERSKNSRKAMTTKTDNAERWKSIFRSSVLVARSKLAKAGTLVDLNLGGWVGVERRCYHERFNIETSTAGVAQLREREVTFRFG